MSVTITVGDCREVMRSLPAESVHCVVTSPPYWGLRDYGLPPLVWGGEPDCEHEWDDASCRPTGHTDDGIASSGLQGGKATQAQTQRGIVVQAFCRRCGAWRGSLGLEPSPDLYVAHLVEVFREVWRVLRPDGTLWLNLGDSYYGAGYSNHKNTGGARRQDGGKQRHTFSPEASLKPKNLIGIPWRVALALQRDGAASPKTMDIVERVRAALLVDFGSWDSVPDKTRSVVEALDREWADAHEGGWWLRSDVVWAKSNPMPESVTDRPTKAHEYVFLLSKSARYFYDADAIREPLAESTLADGRNATGRHTQGEAEGSKYSAEGNSPALPSWYRSKVFVNPMCGRNRRSVWTIPTQPFPEAHFATFPPALVEPMIRAGTSERGCCPKCGAPWRRVVEKAVHKIPVEERTGRASHAGQPPQQSGWFWQPPEVRAVAWRPGCTCDAGEPAPCTVLDPFGGAGTAGLVADRLGRDAILIELNPDYAQMARRRIEAEAQMFADVSLHS